MKFILIVILAGHAQYAVGPFATHLDCTKHLAQIKAAGLSKHDLKLAA